MSLETWKARYYPIPADQTTKSDALFHSLRKWTGLLPAALAEHGLSSEHGNVVEVAGRHDALGISAGTCALCWRFLGPSSGCSECPLRLHLGMRCDAGAASPWASWTRISDHRPQPMIDALWACLQKTLHPLGTAIVLSKRATPLIIDDYWWSGDDLSVQVRSHDWAGSTYAPIYSHIQNVMPPAEADAFHAARFNDLLSHPGTTLHLRLIQHPLATDGTPIEWDRSPWAGDLTCDKPARADGFMRVTGRIPSSPVGSAGLIRAANLYLVRAEAVTPKPPEPACAMVPVADIVQITRDMTRLQDSVQRLIDRAMDSSTYTG